MSDNVLANSEDGTITYRQLTSKYLDEACEVVLNTLFAGGNVSKTVGVSEDPEALKELNQISQKTAKDGLSIIAIDTNTKRVAGVAFNKILLKSQKFYESFGETFKNPKSLKIIEFIITTDNICDLFEHCQVDCLMEHLFLGVLPEYRKRGIAKKLTELSIDFAEKLRKGDNVRQSLDGEKLNIEPVPEVVTAIFTSFISQKIGQELGFEVVAERSNTKLELGGEVLENLNSETAVTKVAFRKLQKNKLPAEEESCK